ncbi:MAG: GNAT family N-acetyltransferase [Candidatus Zixiibacteriota bacterium]|nr:MAG: GNAT family N-acetyltransferase [candidate division Zixibacteria bacterium]
MPIYIRKMTPDDIAAVVKIIREHEDFDGDCSQDYYDGYFGDSKRTESSREENFVSYDSESGQVIGVCGFCPDKYDTPNILWLNWFYLSEDYRGKGIGVNLLEFTINRILDMKISKVYLDTSSYHSYAKAIQLYKDFGFGIEGDLKDYYGKGENFLIMGLDLNQYKQKMGISQ